MKGPHEIAHHSVIAECQYDERTAERSIFTSMGIVFHLGSNNSVGGAGAGATGWNGRGRICGPAGTCAVRFEWA
jgi:hypothetical protein